MCEHKRIVPIEWEFGYYKSDSSDADKMYSAITLEFAENVRVKKLMCVDCLDIIVIPWKEESKEKMCVTK